MKTLSGFKQFILRGNVVDLAVGVVIGASFGALVNSLVSDILTPFIAVLVKVPDFSSLSFTIGEAEFLYGHFLNTVISFVIVATAIYFLVITPLHAFLAKRGESKEPTTKKCPECLSVVPQQAKRCAFCTERILA